MHQKLILIGTLGRDPEMRYTPDGKPVTSFSMAVNSGWGENKSTMWVKVTAWNKQAETANQYLKKGHKVYVEGELSFDKETGGPKLWSGQDGKARASFEVTLREMKFLQSKGEGTPKEESREAPNEEDCPF